MSSKRATTLALSPEGYDNIVPGAAERIIQIAEQEQEHRHRMEDIAINAEIENDKTRHKEITTGQHYALITTITAFAVCGIALFTGNPTIAGIIGGTTVVGLVTVFVTEKRHTPPSTTPTTEEPTTVQDESTQN